MKNPILFLLVLAFLGCCAHKQPPHLTRSRPTDWFAGVHDPRNEKFTKLVPEGKCWVIQSVTPDRSSKTVTYQLDDFYCREESADAPHWVVVCNYAEWGGACLPIDAGDVQPTYFPDGSQWCEESVIWSTCELK